VTKDNRFFWEKSSSTFILSQNLQNTIDHYIIITCISISRTFKTRYFIHLNQVIQIFFFFPFLFIHVFFFRFALLYECVDKEITKVRPKKKGNSGVLFTWLSSLAIPPLWECCVGSQFFCRDKYVFHVHCENNKYTFLFIIVFFSFL
jgi:hypothetical protein